MTAEVTGKTENFDSNSVHHVVESLLHARGIDLSCYNPKIIRKAVLRRSAKCGTDTEASYLEYLLAHEDEGIQLRDAIALQCTDFFRDGFEWQFLKEEILPELLKLNRPITIWCAACSTGQETFSLAMFLADALGRKAFLEKVSIYATDMSAYCVEAAQEGTFTVKELASVQPEMVDRFFRPMDERRYKFDPELMSRIEFSVHNLVTDETLENVDLIICRNALIYFNSEAQSAILKKLYEALVEGGFLFLGKADRTDTRLFERLDHEQIFRKRAADQQSIPYWRSAKIMLTQRALENSPCAQIILDADCIVVYANRAARQQLGLGVWALGKKLSEISPCFESLCQSVRERVGTMQPIEGTLSISDTNGEQLRVRFATAALNRSQTSAPSHVVAFHPLNR